MKLLDTESNIEGKPKSHCVLAHRHTCTHMEKTTNLHKSYIILHKSYIIYILLEQLTSLVIVTQYTE